jgi:hypothetical protein
MAKNSAFSFNHLASMHIRRDGWKKQSHGGEANGAVAERK